MSDKGRKKRKTKFGRAEWCSMPDLGIPLIKARIDTGAKTSAIHARNIAPFEKDGVQYVSFEIHPIQRTRKATIRCEDKVNDYRCVKSTTGTTEERYVIETRLQIGGDYDQLVEVTLTNRRSMSYRMLIGRQALNKRAIIDPGRSCLHGKNSKGTVYKAYGL